MSFLPYFCRIICVSLSFGAIAGPVAAQGPVIQVEKGSTQIPNGGTDALSGLLNAGQDSKQTYTIRNAGGGTLILTNVAISAQANVSATAEPLRVSTLKSNYETNLFIDATPRGSGAFSFKVTINSNDADRNPFTFTVSGTGTASPQIEVERGSTQIAIGGTDALGGLDVGLPTEETYVVSNTGNANLTVNDAVISEASNVTATISEQPAGAVSPGGTANMVIDVTPTAGGAFSFKVSIPNDDADENPFTFTVSGAGNAPEIEVLRGSTQIANNGTDAVGQIAGQNETYTISNMGNVALSLSDVDITSETNVAARVAAPPFSSVAPGGETTMVIDITPAGDDPFSFDVAIFNDDADENPFTFTVSGTGLAPQMAVTGSFMSEKSDISNGGTQNIQSVFIFGATNELDYAISNGGNMPLTLMDAVISNASSNVTATIATQPASTVAPSDQTTLAIDVVPIGPGSFSFDVSIPNDAPGSPFTFTVSESPHPVVGSIDGSFSVQQGAATYTLDLSLPPGVGGATPNLGLSYSSGQGNGALGVGFRLQGVSGISRCGTQIASDGVKGGVTYGDGDRYCLDGQRLINVGTVEAPEYRTQHESWQRLVPVSGTCSTDPCGFRLSRGDGTLVTFGVDDAGSTENGSAIRALGPDGIRVWMQDTLVDLNGNRVTFGYTQQPTLTSGATSDQTGSGQGYLDRISYGPAGQPTRLVEFFYVEGRSDTLLSYLGGGSITTALLLREIRTSLVPSDTQHVMSYTLDYEPAPTTGRSRLQAVTQCAASGVCLNPTTFTWTDGGDSFEEEASTTHSIANNTDAFVGDFNGDGRTDILATIAIDWTLYPANESGFDGGQDTCVPDSLETTLFGDFNGDGITDLYGTPGDGNDGTLYAGSPTGLNCACSDTCTPVTGIDYSDELYAADFNGDGFTDLLASSPGFSQVFLAGKDGFTRSSQSGQGLMEEGGETWFGDFNGDGRADALFIADGGAGTLYFSEETTGRDTRLGTGVPVGAGAQLDGTKTWVADFNNDGLVDVMTGDSVAPGAVSAYINYGTGTTLEAGPGLTVELADENYVGDFNGDGLPDLFVAQGAGTLYLGDGTDFTCIGGDGNCTPMNADVDVDSSFFGDFNGDGLTDIFTGDGPSSTFHFAGQDGDVLPFNQAADMLASVTDGYGGKTTITYLPITDSSVYSAEDSLITALGNLYQARPLSPTFMQTYPVRPIRGGQYVVAGYTQTTDATVNDQGYDYTYSYYYEHGLLNLYGRGWMGYATVTKSDPQLQAQTTTTYRQDFPFNGRPRQQTTCPLGGSPTCATNDALQTVTAQWCCVDTQMSPQGICSVDTQTSPQGTCSVDNQGYTEGDTQVFFVSPQSTTTTDATLGSNLTTTYTYDDWGNLQTTGALADASDPLSVPLYTCSAFVAPDEDAWIFSYAQYHKKTTNSACTTSISTWNAGEDLRLSYFDYDGNYNRTHRMSWDDQNDQWIGAHVGYTAQGLPETVTESSGATVADLTDVTGTTSRATYDSAFSSYVTSLTTPDPGSGAGPLTLGFAHDARFGVLVAKQDPNGNIVNHCVDDFGRKLAIQGPKQGEEKSTNCIDSATYPYVDQAFTGNDDLVTTESITYSYEAPTVRVVESGRGSWDDGTWTSVTRVLDGLGRTVAMNYVNDNNTPMTRQTVYQDPDRVLRQSLPAESADQFLVYFYDPAGRVTSTTQPTWDIDGTLATSTNTFQYGSSNTLTVTQASESSDPFQQIRRVRYYGGQPLAYSAETVKGGTTTMAYDGLGRITGVTSPVPATGDAVTDTLTYDSLGRIVQRTDSGTGTRTFTFGPRGVLDHEIDPMGQKIVFGWDALHRQTSQETYALVGGGFSLESTVTVTYDVGSGENLKGRTATASITRSLPFEVEAVGYDFGYDAWGRQTSQAIAFGGQVFPFDLTYDPMGRSLSRTYPKVNGARPQATYSFWESYGGLSTVGYTSDSSASPTTQITFSNYNARGQAGSASYANGVTESWTYFENGLLASHLVKEKSGAALINERTGWNPSNQLSTVLDCNHTTQAPCPTGSGGDNTDHGATYTYELLRLHSVQDADGTHTYCYDDAGNLVQSDGVVFTYTGNQVIGGTDAATPDQCGSTGQDTVFSAQYDPNGNLWSRTMDGTELGLTTGVEGWVLQADLADETFQRFTYDYTGQRISQTVYKPDGTTIDHVVVYPAPDFEVTLANGGSAQYTVYLVGPGGKQAAFTEPLAGPEVDQLAQQLGVTLDPEAPPVQPSALVFHLDQVGSTQAVTDADGSSYATVSYDAWGQPTVVPAANATFRPLFGGREFTPETGLYYANARYLDAFSGRFVSADTQVAAGPLVPDSFNDYAYALNNPVLYADPTGHFPTAKVALGVLVGVTAVALAAAGLDVAAAGEIEAAEDVMQVNDAVDMVVEAEAPPDQDTPLLPRSTVDEQPGPQESRRRQARTDKIKKYGSNFIENMVQSEVVNTAKYGVMHGAHQDWSWKGYGYSSGLAVLSGMAGFDAGTIADSIAGAEATQAERAISTLIRGPIQGAAIADMGRALNAGILHDSGSRNWAITTARGGTQGFVFSFMVFGAKEWGLFPGYEP